MIFHVTCLSKIVSWQSSLGWKDAHVEQTSLTSSDWNSRLFRQAPHLLTGGTRHLCLSKSSTFSQVQKRTSIAGIPIKLLNCTRSPRKDKSSLLYSQMRGADANHTVGFAVTHSLLVLSKDANLQVLYYEKDCTRYLCISRSTDECSYICIKTICIFLAHSGCE